MMYICNSKWNRHPLVHGTVILMATGFFTRFLGFLYRIFLSRTFTEEQIGIYQLIFPLYAMGYSLCTAGIETSISRCVAKSLSNQNIREALHYLYKGLAISFSLACMVTCFLQRYASHLSVLFLKEPRCEPLLYMLSYCFPFASLHGCISGFYFGKRETKTPAVSQMIEQTVRILFVVFICLYLERQRIHTSVIVAVGGIVIGELASSFYSMLSIRKEHAFLITQAKTLPLQKKWLHWKELLSIGVPLTCNRFSVNVLQSIEAASIPLSLRLYGYSGSRSLRLYGVYSGMALPVILFPSALTSALSTLLLPTVTALHETQNYKKLLHTCKRLLAICCLTGLGCTICLTVFGRQLGMLFFQSRLAGDFIVTLSWICPFLYSSSILLSILNGLNYARYTLLFTLSSLLIRLGSVWFLIPHLGMKGYLYGLLGSQILLYVLSFSFLLYKYKRDYPS